MYTGLIQEVGRLDSKTRQDGFDQIFVKTSEKFLRNLQVGASVALDGICISVTRVSKDGFFAEVSDATTLTTNFKNTEPQDLVNLERSALINQEVGGHLVTGHVYGTGEVVDVARTGGTVRLGIKIPEETLMYVFAKGFTAINGASLTIAEIEKSTGTAYVNLVPETLRNSTFSSISIGDEVNIEIEPTTKIIVDTLQNSLKIQTS